MQNQEHAMGTSPIFGLLMKMSIPPMVSMLIQSLYNIVDSVFVAQLSEDALTAVSLAFPLQNLVLAFAVGLGVAVNALMAKALGAKDSQSVQDACHPRAAAHGGACGFLCRAGAVFYPGRFIHVFTQLPGFKHELPIHLHCNHAGVWQFVSHHH